MDASQLDIMSNFEIKMGVLNAMTELMKDTPFDKLTIASICQAAHISRTTFYRYFDDKFSVPQWHARYAFMQGTNEIGRTLSWYEGYYITELLMTEQLDFYAAVSKSNDYNAIDNYSPRTRRQTFYETVTEYKHLELTEQMRFEIDAIVESETHLFPKWHNGAYECTLEEACAWMVKCVPNDLYELLKTPTNPRRVGFVGLSGHPLR